MQKGRLYLAVIPNKFLVLFQFPNGSISSFLYSTLNYRILKFKNIEDGTPLKYIQKYPRIIYIFINCGLFCLYYYYLFKYISPALPNFIRHYY